MRFLTLPAGGESTSIADTGDLVMLDSSSFPSACRALAATALLVLAGAARAQAPAPQLANPASRNCVAKGGAAVMQTAPGGGQYGVCVFADHRQCEEWALLRGQCHAGTTAPGRIQARFACAEGRSIDATFIHTGASRVQLAFSDGRRMTLPQAVSADGGRYADKAESIVFWNKGQGAFFEENGRTTYADCTAQH